MKSSGDAIRQTFYLKGFNLMAVGRSPRAFTKSVCAGADPGFFLGGGALVSCSTSTPINHIVFFWQNTSCIRKAQVILGGGGGNCAPPAPSP